ncbi:MAG: YfhO family protein [Anaerovoracaceae bacterium]|jgi:hypothetical protein
MLRERRIRLICILIPVAAAAMILIIQFAGPGVPGSRVDWLEQHAAFADYFRKRFYQTHDLFPQFASGIGGGQNIYNFAYYGLFSPFVLLSYLFPFIPMEAWLTGIGAAAQAADGVLCFIWLKRRFPDVTACFCALILELSTAITFHSYFQIMFADYMPFLLLILIGADPAQEQDDGRLKRRGALLMAAGSLLVILTSYYYSPASMLTVIVYLFMTTPGGEKYFRRTLRRFLPAVYGCLLSLFYVVPVFCAILGGRGSGTAAQDLSALNIAAGNFLYSPYGLGLTALPLFAVCIRLVSGRRREAFVSLMIAAAMIIPAFAWVMNGGLYARSKIFIPMLPLVAMLCAGLFEDIRERKISPRRLTAGCAVCILAAAAGASALPRAGLALLAADLVISAAALFRYCRSRSFRSLMPALVLILCVSAGTAMYSYGGQTSRALLRQVQDPAVGSMIRAAAESEGSAVRTVVHGSYKYEKACVNRTAAAGQLSTTVYSSLSNPHYRKFMKDICLPCQARNRLCVKEQHDLLFLRFMGVKYIVSSTGGSAQISENKNAAPMFYVTDRTAAQDDFAGLSWQQKQIALCEYAFVPGGSGSVKVPISKINAEFTGIDSSDGGIVKVNARKPVHGTLRLSRPVRAGETLFISFRVKNNSGGSDAAVTIDGVRNTKSRGEKYGRQYMYDNGNKVFHYTISAKAGTRTLPVTFDSGDLEIRGISVSTGSVDENMSSSLYSSPVRMKELTDGNGFEGTVSASGSWLITSLPYDCGFRVTADGREVRTKIVNDGFLGAGLPEGCTHIRIEYRAQGSAAGAASSAAVIAAGIVYAAVRRKRLSGQA